MVERFGRIGVSWRRMCWRGLGCGMTWYDGLSRLRVRLCQSLESITLMTISVRGTAYYVFQECYPLVCPSIFFHRAVSF